MALLIIGTLAMAVGLCLLLAGAVNLALTIAPDAAPVLSIVLALAALALGYLGFRGMVNALFGYTYG